MRGKRRRERRTSYGIRLEGRDPAVPCEVCGVPTQRARLYELAGSAGDVLVTLRGVPCRLCPDDSHPRCQSSNDFEAKLSESIHSSDAFPRVAGRPRRPICAACRGRMREMSERPGDVEATVRIDGAEIDLTVSAPVVKCARCGALQLPSTPESARGVQDAIDHALARGGLRR